MKNMRLALIFFFLALLAGTHALKIHVPNPIASVRSFVASEIKEAINPDAPAEMNEEAVYSAASQLDWIGL